MIQVDIFWTYGLGASFAVATHRQLKHGMERSGESPFRSQSFVTMLLFLSFLFVPSSVYMLWGYPSWQTMHVGGTDMPPWLVATLVAGNVALAIFGYWVAVTLIRRNRVYTAFLHWAAGYFLMFLMIAYGWDGTGYRRYFSQARENFTNWSPDNVQLWMNSELATMVTVFTVAMVPLLFYWLSGWIKEGRSAAYTPENVRIAEPVRWAIIAWIAVFIFVVLLGGALATNALMRVLGAPAGLVVAAVVIFIFGARRGGLLHWLYRRIAVDPT